VLEFKRIYHSSDERWDMKIPLAVLLLVTMLLTVGCVSNNQTVPVSPTETVISTSVPTVTITALLTPISVARTPVIGQDPIIGTWKGISYGTGVSDNNISPKDSIRFDSKGTYYWYNPPPIERSEYNQQVKGNASADRSAGWTNDRDWYTLYYSYNVAGAPWEADSRMKYYPSTDTLSMLTANPPSGWLNRPYETYIRVG
jgi:hypothetical protein